MPTYAKARLTSAAIGGTGKTCLGVGMHCPSARHLPIQYEELIYVRFHISQY